MHNLTLLEISILPADFPAEFDQKSAGNGFWFPAKTFVGNCLLRFLKSAGNLPAEFPTENEDEAKANVPADNPQQYRQIIPQETHFRR
jgi:hypothetical protein